ncbi:MAG: glutamate--tRNA ligase [Bacteroidales bacterium]|jgi:glutamyl-tRNA synthetase|nr:glutamate--tRNA ligase [Bacteroidales bacterium]
MSEIRVRFAPSPTGPLHLGGLRTALFNYLFARRHGGKFLVRIEDTDQTRYVPGAEEYILEALRWCGIEPDEGVGAGGDLGPYRQSERKEMYAGFAQQLIESGDAYYAFDSAEELSAKRKELEEKKETFTYDLSTRMSMKNSLTLSKEETDGLISKGEPFVIRFMFKENETIHMKDIIRGDVKVESAMLDDKVLFKSDGMPTYHLANVVDDYLMKISHVIRGEEWLPSLPLHVSLYRAFGWINEMPEFAHLPLILKPDGKGKLSKRDGDKGGFPVFPLEWKDPASGSISRGYREAGYFPEACVNILAFLGWNPGTDKEIYSLDELSKHFDLNKVGKAGAKFDPDKARWYNHQYLQERPVDELVKLFIPVLTDNEIDASIEFVTQVVALVKERANFVSDLLDQSSFFFSPPNSYDEKVIKKRWKEDTPELMKSLAEILASIEPFEAEIIETKVKADIEEREWGMGAVMNALRLVLVGTSKGPSLFDLAEVLGKKETISRIEKGLAEIQF